MKEFEEAVKDLLEAIAATGKRHLEKLLDEGRATVADAAWVCVDSGLWKAHHFFSPSVSDKRILEAAEAIKARLESTKNRTIELTPAEDSSGLYRVKWAEGLIKQLPEDHKGRNSWLLNYGEKTAEPVETVELKIYSLRHGLCGTQIVIRFYDAAGKQVFVRTRSGHVKYSAQLPFIDRFEVPGGYSFYTASVVGECCYTVERLKRQPT